MAVDAPPPTLSGAAAAWDLSRLPDEYSEALESLLSGVDKLARREPSEVDGPQAAVVAAVLASMTSRLEVLGARMLPIVEADGLWAVRGAKSFTRWVATEHRLSQRAARAQVRLGRALRDHLPVTAHAGTVGAVPAESAQILATLAPTTELRRQVLADPEQECNEAFLVAQAEARSVDDFRLLTRHWSSAVDPDADDRGYVEATDREFFQLDRTTGGYHVGGFLTTDHGQTIAAALHAITPVPAAGDERTSGQRRAQALNDLARIVLDRGLVGAGRAVRPRINVLVPYATLCALADAAATIPEGSSPPSDPSEENDASPSPPPVRADAVSGRSPVPAGPLFEDGSPVPRALLDRLACDSEINRYVFGAESEILDVGRAERTFTGPRRAAIIARDKRCRYPGCHAPPIICEAHHVRHWTRDNGSTSVDNGILLCWHHHDVVHRKHIEITRESGRWRFSDAIGREIEDRETTDKTAQEGQEGHGENDP